MSRVSSTARRATPSLLVVFLCGWLLATLLPAATATAARPRARPSRSPPPAAPNRSTRWACRPGRRRHCSGPPVTSSPRTTPTPSAACCSATCNPAAAIACASTQPARNRNRSSVHTQASAPWDPSVYRQSIPTSGYGYLTTRDGTKLAIDVRLPSQRATTYPTVIEYAGYGYADPAGPDSGIAVLANLMGFAVVDVNMRGTGCSGGAFDYFETLQDLDGYDVDRGRRPPAVGARPQGRHDRDLLRRHQSALHGPARSPGPRGDLAASR